MKKIILNLLLISTLNFAAKAQLVIDSVSILNTCLDCDSINVIPLPSSYGSLYIGVSGGASPYTYSLTGAHSANTTPLITSSTNGITNSYNSLCQDTYTLIVTDNNGDSLIYNFSTIPPPSPTLTIDSVSVKPDSTNNPDAGFIELHVTTNADSVFYLIEDEFNTLNLGTLGGWQASPIFDSLPGGFNYKVFVDIYPKIVPNCGTGISSSTNLLLIYVPVLCANDGYAFFDTESFGCAGDTMLFTDFSNPGGGFNNFIIDYFWNYGDGSSSSNFGSTEHIYTTAGTYFVSLQISTVEGCVYFHEELITINPIPTPGFTQTDDGAGLYSFTNTSSSLTDSAATYIWDFGDGNTSTAINPNHQYAAPGTSYVCLTASSFNCEDVHCDSISYQNTVGVNKINNQHHWGLHPNPVEDYLTITNITSTISKIEIIDITGKTIKSISSNAHKIDVIDLHKGFYFIRIATDDVEMTKKFVKQ